MTPRLVSLRGIKFIFSDGNLRPFLIEPHRRVGKAVISEGGFQIHLKHSAATGCGHLRNTIKALIESCLREIMKINADESKAEKTSAPVSRCVPHQLMSPLHPLGMNVSVKRSYPNV